MRAFKDGMCQYSKPFVWSCSLPPVPLARHIAHGIGPFSNGLCSYSSRIAHLHIWAVIHPCCCLIRGRDRCRAVVWIRTLLAAERVGHHSGGPVANVALVVRTVVRQVLERVGDGVGVYDGDPVRMHNGCCNAVEQQQVWVGAEVFAADLPFNVRVTPKGDPPDALARVLGSLQLLGEHVHLQ
jgi:hypothetical protein